MDVKNIIVIGASAGGIKAVTQLLPKIPSDLPVAIFVVFHLGKTSSASVLRQHFEQRTSYICRVPADQETIKAGHVYLAPPDYQLIIKPGIIRLNKGAYENRWRPSVDVLFRTAAAAYNSRVTGIILSGMLDDGTSGMWAIKRCGGICIVQEPDEAEFSDMPVNVLNNMEVDYRVPVTDMGYILDDIISKPVEPHPVPEEIQTEAAITERMNSTIEEMKHLGTHSNYTCPDCGGNLWEVKNEPSPRYRCHTGHAYSENALLDKQTEQTEESLWISIRMLEERRNMLLNMVSRENTPRNLHDEYQKRVEALKTHIERLKLLLVSLSKLDDSNEGLIIK